MCFLLCISHFCQKKCSCGQGDAGLKLQLTEPGCLDILAVIPTDIQSLDSEGSGTQLSASCTRVGVMRQDLLE